MSKIQIDELVKDIRLTQDKERSPCSKTGALFNNSHAKTHKIFGNDGMTHLLVLIISVGGRVTFELNGRKISRKRAENAIEKLCGSRD